MCFRPLVVVSQPTDAVFMFFSRLFFSVLFGLVSMVMSTDFLILFYAMLICLKSHAVYFSSQALQILPE